MVKELYTYSSANIKWNKRLTPIHLQPFTQSAGPQVDILSVVEEIFLLFISSNPLEHIVAESNRYAQECMGERFTTWPLRWKNCLPAWDL